MMNLTTEKLRVLVIIPYAGSEKLTEMTARMLKSLHDCVEYALFHMGQQHEIEVFLYGNAPKVPLSSEQLGVARQFVDPQNVGFGRAINNAIAMHWTSGFTHYLILNNDLEFPYDDWLECLFSAIEEVNDFYVLAPATSITSNPECVTEGPVAHKIPRRLRQISAYAWLVPHRVVKAIKPRFGFELFDPEFFCYGEDDYTGAILRKLYGGTPFKIVYQSWVKHLKGKTGEEMGLKSGMRVNIDLLKRKLQANKLK
jgi:hypothetical protein